MVKGQTYDKQLFESEVFRHFVNIFLNKQSGVTRGCELTKNTQSITVESGTFVIAGGFLKETTGTENTIPNEAGYYKLVYEIDLSKTNTREEFNQGSYKFIKALGDYPELTQEDLENGGKIYQLAFCQFRITETGLQDFKDIRKFIEYNIIGANMTLYTNVETSYSHTGSSVYLQEPVKFQASRDNSRGMLTTEKNGIKIGKGIHHINVKGIITALHSESDGRELFIYIRKNDKIFSENAQYMSASQKRNTVDTFINYLEVEEGDLVQLYVAMDNANFKIEGVNYAAMTQLSVEVVD